MILLFAIILGFGVGSIPWGYIIAKTIKKIDIREYGSGNIGTTNVWRVCGKRLGILAFVLDFSKSAIPVLLIHNYFGLNTAILCGVGTMLGHSFTPWLKFKGGKGVATGLGAFVGLVPIEAVITFCVWVLVLIFTKWVSVASLSAAAVLVILIFLSHHSSPIFWFGLAGFVLVVVLHRSNIKRLMQGKEPKIK
jgi:glycerol-3-phosphate acyltransferase PlsY